MKKRRFGASLGGGLAIGLLCFGLTVALAFFVIRPMIEQGTRGLSAHLVGDIRVWSAKGGNATEAASIGAETEALLYVVAESIGVDPEKLPLPIDLFVHRDVDELIDSVMNRDSDYRSTNWTILDRLPWEDPRARVAELVLAYGWGKCTSQILYAGMTLVAAYPDRDFHPFVAALPDRSRHSVSELISLESSGSFPKTFYQTYTSPFVLRFGLSLAATKRYYDIPKHFLSALAQQLYLESASLVQYLIQENTSMDAVREAWTVGFSENILGALTGSTPDALTRAWHAAALRDGRESADYAAHRVRLLIESGDCDAAYELTESWSSEAATYEQLELMLLSSVLVGKLERAGELLALSRAASIDPEVVRCGGQFVDGTVQEVEGVRLVSASPAPLSVVELDRIRAAAETLRDLLESPGSDLPDPATVVLCADSDRKEQAHRVFCPFGLPSSLTHVAVAEDVSSEMALVLSSYVLGETRSKLLARGFALLVNREPSQLVTAALRLRDEGKWQPLGTLTYMGNDEDDVDVQAAVLVRTLIEEYGTAKLRDIWRSTSTLGEGYCLDTALRTHVGVTRRELEELFLAAQPASL